MNNNPVYVAFRLTPDDEYLLNNFISYYKNLNVTGFFANLNYRLDCDEENFECFANRVKQNYPEIIFNTGPNRLDQNEMANIQQIWKLMGKNIPENSYIIPADADEFHEYPYPSLEENITHLQENNFLYIKGHTIEKISATGHVIKTDSSKNIFEQYPNQNKYLFSKPKISLMSNLHMYKRAGVGHHDFFHGIDAEIRKKISNKRSKTHHFRWNLEGKIRTEKWHRLFTNNEWMGWKSPEETAKRLKIYEMNLLEENWSKELFDSL
jgi:hypothetical protein